MIYFFQPSDFNLSLQKSVKWREIETITKQAIFGYILYIFIYKIQFLTRATTPIVEKSSATQSVASQAKTETASKIKMKPTPTRAKNTSAQHSTSSRFDYKFKMRCL